MENRSGKCGRPTANKGLPDIVVYNIERFKEIGNIDTDWTIFAERPGGPLWMLVRCWEDENTYNVIASIVQYESELIED